MDLNISHYKHFQKIEIELFPLIYEKKNYFINIKNNKYKRFFHIYFNDAKKEIHKIYFDEKENVTKIKIVIDDEINTLSELFKSCKCIEKINFKKFYNKKKVI